MTKQGILVLIAVPLVILAGIIFLFGNSKTAPIASFDECARAGYPVMESYPRQCRTPEGELFVEPISSPEPEPAVSSPEPAPAPLGKCFVGGCSGQICSDQEGMMSTCEYKEEYACYKNEKCERQKDGKCGWTLTPTLSACLMVYYD